MNLEIATKENITEVRRLINLAYRGEQGWTTERNLVSGDRTTDTEIELAIAKNNSYLLVHKIDRDIVACICIEMKGSEAHISSFAVHPDYQATGLGKKILHAAENYASTKHEAIKYAMTVLSKRHELIAFYERRGYKRSGTLKEFPVHLNVGIPKMVDLKFECLEKSVTIPQHDRY